MSWHAGPTISAYINILFNRVSFNDTNSAFSSNHGLLHMLLLPQRAKLVSYHDCMVVDWGILVEEIHTAPLEIDTHAGNILMVFYILIYWFVPASNPMEFVNFIWKLLWCFEKGEWKCVKPMKLHNHSAKMDVSSGIKEIFWLFLQRINTLLKNLYISLRANTSFAQCTAVF